MWVNGICLPPPSTVSHTQKGSHIMQAPEAQQAGSALAAVAMATGPAAWTTVACQTPAGLQAWQPGTLQASSQAAEAGAALLSPWCLALPLTPRGSWERVASLGTHKLFWVRQAWFESQFCHLRVSDLEQVTLVCLAFIELAMGASRGSCSRSMDSGMRAVLDPTCSCGRVRVELWHCLLLTGPGPWTHLSPRSRPCGVVDRTSGFAARPCAPAALCHVQEPQFPHR